jgi:hypothetical protein
MKRLILIPFIGGLIASAGMWLPEQQALVYHRSVLIVAALATAFAAFAAARMFERDDRLFWSWSMIGAGYLVAALRYGFRLYTLLFGGGITNRTLLNSLLILQNVLIAVALLLFVLAWRATGLATPGSRSAQFASIMLGIAVAVLVGGYPLMRGIATAQTDLVLLVSTLGDMVGIALMVPLLMPALALRGGLLMHTWAYLAATEGAWLLYDIWYATKESFGLATGTARGIEEGIRVIAILFALSAAVAQRRAVRG